ncbi:MAG: NADH-quinone oxidoreductase subunit N [Vicinamibacterales bacterium]
MSNYVAIIPIVCVVLTATAAMLAEAFRQPGERMPLFGLGLIGLVGAAISSIMLWDTDARSFGVIRADNFTLFINLILCVVGILTMLFSTEVVEREGLPPGEFYALTLFGLSGMMLMAAATDLLVIFLALEVLSLSVYVLTGLRRSSATGAEAAFKYFLLGAFSSAFFLYGIAFAFAVSGSTRLDQLGVAMSAQGTGTPQTLALLAVGLLAVGFAFKVSAVPFHMWTPDAYEGAPTIVTAFMSTGVKAAAFAAFVRVFLSALEPMKAEWIPVLSVIAAATMILGTVVGVVQTNIKRMLAYSSIAHAGYLLLGIVATSATGKAAVLFYLLSYAVTNLGALGIVALLGTPQHEHDELRDFAGLWQSRPALAGVMAIFLLSLGGFPPTAGFIGKWYIFAAAVQGGYYWLAIIGVLTSVVSVFFYLRIIVMMYMTEGNETARPRVPAAAVAGLGLATLAVLYLGVLPTRIIDLALDSIETIL